MAIVIVGMLDEREEALKIMKERIESKGHDTVLIDISIGTGAGSPSLAPDISGRDLVRAREANRKTGEEAVYERERMSAAMSKELASEIQALYEGGRLEGIIAIGGMTGSLIALKAMRVLPFGVPKLLISSAAAMPAHAEQLAEFFGSRDITVMHTVVDTVGMNRMVRRLAINGANAISGMVEGRGSSSAAQRHRQQPSIAVTEFGFCDQGAHFIRERLETEYEVVSFHATGLGDRSFVELVRQGLFEGAIDLVPGSFSEWLLGGNRPSGEDRLDLAKDLSIPYVFCPGGCDLISCGPIDRKDKSDPLWISRRLAERKLHVQDALRVQARMTAEEGAQVALVAAEKLNRYLRKERVKVVIPERGFSSLSVKSGPLYDPAADAAFIATLEKCLSSEIEVRRVDADINSPDFAGAVVKAFSDAREACGHHDAADGSSLGREDEAY
jgi:uncharacterized protein (UPF0261 family)